MEEKSTVRQLAILETKLDAVLSLLDTQKREYILLEKKVLDLHEQHSSVRHWIRGAIAVLAGLSSVAIWMFTSYREAEIERIDFMYELCREVNQSRVEIENYPQICIIEERRRRRRGDD